MVVDRQNVESILRALIECVFGLYLLRGIGRLL